MEADTDWDIFYCWRNLYQLLFYQIVVKIPKSKLFITLISVQKYFFTIP